MEAVKFVLGYLINTHMKTLRNLMLLLVAVSFFSSCLVQDGRSGNGHGHGYHKKGNGHHKRGHGH